MTCKRRWSSETTESRARELIVKLQNRFCRGQTRFRPGRKFGKTAPCRCMIAAFNAFHTARKVDIELMAIATPNTGTHRIRPPLQSRPKLRRSAGYGDHAFLYVGISHLSERHPGSPPEADFRPQLHEGHADSVRLLRRIFPVLDPFRQRSSIGLATSVLWSSACWLWA